MNKQIIIGVIAVILIGGGAYYFTISQTAVTGGEHGAATHEPTNSMGTSSKALGAIVAGTRINIKNSSFKPGNQNISFELFGKDGHAFNDTLLKVTP